MMDTIRLLIAEDNEQELSVCRETIARYKDEKSRSTESVECKSLSEALATLNNTFDGAIIDIKLGDQGAEGIQLVEKIKESHFRIPVAILTGTPDAVDPDFEYIGVFKKGEPGSDYISLLDLFWGIFNTGLTRIMGGRGVIEETLGAVFLQNILPQKDKWVSYGENDSSKTEKALLRHTLNHLLQLLDDDQEKCYPEEFYITPPLKDGIQTGSILTRKEDGNYFVVLTPACDLIPRDNGRPKTEWVLLVEVDLQAAAFPDIPMTGLSNNQKGLLKNAYQNKIPYFHWFPKTNFFPGGFLNFRKINAVLLSEYQSYYDTAEIQISPFFTKDVVARFSSYYARQGQPEIDFDNFVAN